MAIIAQTEGHFFFNNQALFNEKVQYSLLETGGIYFVENKVYLALSANTFRQMSELRLVPSLPEADAPTVEEGLIYYAADTNLLAVSMETEWVYLNNAFVDITSDTNSVHLVKADGTSIVIPIPTVDVGTGTDGELVSANAAGELQRSGKTAVNIRNETIQYLLYSYAGIGLEGILQAGFGTKMDRLPSEGEEGSEVFPEDEILLANDEGGAKASGKKFVDFFDETATTNVVADAKAVNDRIELRIQEALSGNRFRGNFVIGSGDSQIVDTLLTGVIGVGDNWEVRGTPGVPGTFLGVAIEHGDIIRFVNRVEENGTITTADFVISTPVRTEVVDALNSSDAYKALSANMGRELNDTKMPKLASGANSRIVVSSGGTNVNRSESIISDSISPDRIKRFLFLGASWATTVTSPILAKFGEDTGSILPTDTPGTALAPKTIIVANRSVRLWAGGGEEGFAIDVFLDPGNPPLNAGDNPDDIILTLPEDGEWTITYSGFDTMFMSNVAKNEVPTVGAILPIIDLVNDSTRIQIDGKLDGKVGKTATGGTGEILLADGNGGVEKGGKTIVNAINEEGTELADEVPSVEAVVNYVQSAGIRWIVD